MQNPYTLPIKRAKLFVMIAIVVLSLTHWTCRGKASYKPPLIPAKLVFDNYGAISVEGELSFFTLVGEFSIGAEYSLKREANRVLVIVRDSRKPPNGFDIIYRLNSDREEFVAVVNGTTLVQVLNRQVLIDVSSGSVKTIEFKYAENTIAQEHSAWWKAFPLGYYPFALVQWMYDDSCIGKWYGLGFLWFLLRFALSLIALFVDFILIFFLGIGVVLHSIFNETVRNIYFGFLGLLLLYITVVMIVGLLIGEQK
jgi:hypothetical protein